MIIIRKILSILTTFIGVTGIFFYDWLLGFCIFFVFFGLINYGIILNESGEE